MRLSGSKLRMPNTVTVTARRRARACPPRRAPEPPDGRTLSSTRRGRHRCCRAHGRTDPLRRACRARQPVAEASSRSLAAREGSLARAPCRSSWPRSRERARSSRGVRLGWNAGLEGAGDLGDDARDLIRLAHRGQAPSSTHRLRGRGDHGVELFLLLRLEVTRKLSGRVLHADESPVGFVPAPRFRHVVHILGDLTHEDDRGWRHTCARAQRVSRAARVRRSARGRNAWLCVECSRYRPGQHAREGTPEQRTTSRQRASGPLWHTCRKSVPLGTVQDNSALRHQ